MALESRVDLLKWVNDLLNLNYNKIEQLGSGAAYCQIMDSIFLDVPMARVKFDTTKEYEYLNNFKILQATFAKHKVGKTIPVERLIKCKFQDNLEFFQWIRRFWKENKDESFYEPMTRRKYLPPATASASGLRSSAPRTTSNLSNAAARSAASSRRTISTSSVASNAGPSLSYNKPRATNGSSLTSSRSGSRVSSASHPPHPHPINKELEQELALARTSLNEAAIELEEYKNAIEALETERNFYFNKLREIEILTETTSDLLKNNVQNEDLNLKDVLIKVQEILYNTEEGFQVPDENDYNDINMEEETF